MHKLSHSPFFLGRELANVCISHPSISLCPLNKPLPFEIIHSTPPFHRDSRPKDRESPLKLLTTAMMRTSERLPCLAEDHTERWALSSCRCWIRATSRRILDATTRRASVSVYSLVDGRECSGFPLFSDLERAVLEVETIQEIVQAMKVMRWMMMRHMQLNLDQNGMDRPVESFRDTSNSRKLQRPLLVPPYSPVPTHSHPPRKKTTQNPNRAFFRRFSFKPPTLTFQSS